MARLYSFFASRSGRHRVVYEEIVRDIAALSPERILEIGSGPGIIASMLSVRLENATISCVDPSETMVNISNGRFRKNGIAERVSASVGNSTNPGIQGKFNIIFASLSFHHWGNGVNDLRKLLGMLEGGGSLMIYENLLPGEGGKGHGISMNFAEHVSFPGFIKDVRTVGDLIILRFTAPE